MMSRLGGYAMCPRVVAPLGELGHCALAVQLRYWRGEGLAMHH